jgi:hypothetical protein
MALSTRALSRAAIVAALAISACSTDKNNTAAFAVTASQPSEGQTIAANSPVGVSFNRAPKTASATFAPDAGAVTTTISGNAASFAPASGSFAAGIAYTVTVTATDANDNGLASPFVVHFNTSAPDTAAPAAVTDLTADSVTSTGVTLHWTATGDDGDTGTATAYEVRYLSGSNCPITVANFGTSGTGTLVTPVAAPKPARSAETLAVTGLTASTSYCFALRVADEAGNLSPISNVATATTSSTADGIPPAAPVVTGVAGNTNVFLQFTAVGDDGNVGTAAQYVVTFEGPVTSCPTTLAGFVNPHAPLTSPGNLPPPDAAGTAETLPVLGLQQRSLYCFVVTVKDAAGNSANSNVVAATTTGTTQAAPSAITDLRATIDGVTNNGSLTQKATLTWTAPDTFDGQSAARYSIRFATFSGATCPLTSANAGTASEIANPPAPQNPGGEESFDVTYALPDILHGVCFAILSQSLSSPLSPISDLATPPIEISDLSVNAGTLTDTSADLTFTAPIFQTGTAAADFLLAYLPETAAGCPAFGSDIPTLDGAVVNDFGASIAGTSVPMTGLQPNTGYCASLLV